MDNCKKRNFVVIYGFGYSGSGAVVDLLKEVNESVVYTSDAKYFGMRDVGGLVDLEHSLLDDWDLCKVSEAIERFLKLCERSCHSSRSFFSTYGMDYEKWFSKDFMKFSHSFIDELTDFRYYSYEHAYLLGHGYWEGLYSRASHLLDKKGSNLLPPVTDRPFFSQPTREQYFEAAKRYISNIYSTHPDCEYLVIDHHPLPVQQFERLKKYYGENTKMIVVDRDPRNIYCSLLKYRVKIGVEMARTHNIDQYVCYHRALRKDLPQSPNILYLRLEDFVLDYENTKERVFDFIGIKAVDHITPKKYFDPAISIKNLDIWRKYESKIPAGTFDKIKVRLAADCFDLDNSKSVNIG